MSKTNEAYRRMVTQTMREAMGSSLSGGVLSGGRYRDEYGAGYNNPAYPEEAHIWHETPEEHLDLVNRLHQTRRSILSNDGRSTKKNTEAQAAADARGKFPKAIRIYDKETKTYAPVLMDKPAYQDYNDRVIIPRALASVRTAPMRKAILEQAYEDWKQAHPGVTLKPYDRGLIRLRVQEDTRQIKKRLPKESKIQAFDLNLRKQVLAGEYVFEGPKRLNNYILYQKQMKGIKKHEKPPYDKNVRYHGNPEDA